MQPKFFLKGDEEMIFRKSCCFVLTVILFCSLIALSAGAVSAHDEQTPSFKKKEKIFAPLIADPRWPHFSMAYQHYTHDGGFGNIFAASFGETLPLYEDGTPSGGRWAVAVQAAGYIIHDLDTNSWDLVNEDYRGGLAFFYRQDDLSGLFSVYHNSSHVGDEFLLHNDVSRVNFSYEAVQTKLSYDAADSLRVYGGIEYLFSPDPDDLKRWMTQIGVEFSGPKKYFNDLIRPVAGLDIKNWQENDWQAEISLRMGGELESEKMLWSRLHFMLEYFNGPSPNGQFHEDNIEYLGLGTHFYF
ncbi:MAG: DUF1207 domain-containing protein [Nitrospiraceae bacterium]|nr:MAG: DUF1207 domain-containing protein [Nitrospiraceae bacterium]